MAPLRGQQALVMLALLACAPTCSPADAAVLCTDAKVKDYTPVKVLMDKCTAATSISVFATNTRTQKDKLCEPCAALLAKVEDPLGLPACIVVDAEGNTRRLRNMLQNQFRFCPGYNVTSSDSGSSDSGGSNTTTSTTTATPKTSSPSTSAANGTTNLGTNRSADAQTSGSSKDSSMGVGVLIGIIGGAVVLLALLAAAFVVQRRRKQHKSGSRRGDSDKFDVSILGDDADAPTSGRASTVPFQMSLTSSSKAQHSDGWNPASSLGPAPASGNMWEDEAIIAARVPKDKIVISSLLSRGGFGEVYLGMYNHERVAVKTLLPETRKDLREINAFLYEVKLMAALEHERIVTFVGVAWDSLTDLCVLSEFMEGGDLRGLVVRFENERRPHGFDIDKIKIALHVAHALTFLHSLRPVVLHRDLKSKNILLDSQLNAKLTDFGVSRESSYRTMTAGVGTSLWMAPEVMLGGRYDDKADVFSYGVVLSELDTHAVPYRHIQESRAAASNHRIPDSALLQMVSLGRLKVRFSPDALPEMVALGNACVALDPKDRPSAADVLYTLHGILKSQ